MKRSVLTSLFLHGILFSVFWVGFKPVDGSRVNPDALRVHITSLGSGETEHRASLSAPKGSKDGPVQQVKPHSEADHNNRDQKKPRAGQNPATESMRLKNAPPRKPTTASGIRNPFASDSPGKGGTGEARELLTRSEPARYQLGTARTPRPDYPWSARRRNQQGRVIIRLYVDAAGHPTKATILHSSGIRALDDAALKTLRKWRVQPAHRMGLPITSVLDVPIRFELH